jgi:hypothetical protein
MPWFKAVLDKVGCFVSALGPTAKAALKLALIVVAVILLYFVIAETASWFAYSYSYSYFSSVLTAQGGVNTWLARAISLVLAAAFLVGTSMTFSLKSSKRRTKGWILLLGCTVAFNLLAYACTRSAAVTDDQDLFVTGTDTLIAKKWYCVSADGTWKLFSSPGYSPMGEKLQEMTPQAAQEYFA